ncbi:pimeloyl-ACP methyl ester carboxylesterase [Oikeobacillus pervagus]|uniref:Pimeloyl-ACP methyl ester carboxylesterase n=1 Tax=Oikeobacillus pervagus TaxID=1325931 RepID=A0AAJ1T7E2_9BACI|nr:alpha/beta hydrolase [Oikeobacillus pervagus]MDQ0216501.1 pimeloyl-ACP methyl ester carboxylesterase [Oikeobacillus pervagus]
MKQNYSVPIQGMRLWYEYDENPKAKDTILLLHGFLSSSFSFRKLIPLLKEDYSVITVDWPPFGKSQRPKRFIYSYENIAKTIIQFLQMMSFESIHIIGHSMGGQLALHMMKQNPNYIERSVLLSCSSYIERAKKKYIAASFLPFSSHLIKRWLEKTGVEGNLHQVVYQPQLIDDEMIVGYTEPFTNKAIFRGLVKFLRHREADLSSEILRTISTPCLLIWGEKDRVVPVEVGKRLASDLQNSEFIVLKETGHLIPEEKPEEVMEFIQKFLR